MLITAYTNRTKPMTIQQMEKEGRWLINGHPITVFGGSTATFRQRTSHSHMEFVFYHRPSHSYRRILNWQIRVCDKTPSFVALGPKPIAVEGSTALPSSVGCTLGIGSGRDGP